MPMKCFNAWNERRLAVRRRHSLHAIRGEAVWKRCKPVAGARVAGSAFVRGLFMPLPDVGSAGILLHRYDLDKCVRG